MAKRSTRHDIADEDGNIPGTDLVPDNLDDYLREFHQTTTAGMAVASKGDAITMDSGLPSIAFLKSNFKTKSAAIRHMNSLGYDVNTISKHLGIRYQHVRNVLTNELKRGPNEDFRLDDRDTSAKLEEF